MPERIQIRRVKGWRLPETATMVTRPTRWGNPYGIRATRNPDGFMVASDDTTWPDIEAAQTRAVELYRAWVAAQGADFIATARLALTGRDLACWCKPGTPCHADVLLAVVNGP